MSKIYGDPLEIENRDFTIENCSFAWLLRKSRACRPTWQPVKSRPTHNACQLIKTWPATYLANCLSIDLPDSAPSGPKYTFIYKIKPAHGLRLDETGCVAHAL